MDKSEFNVQRLDHLGLVAGFCKEAGIEEFIDKRLPKTSAKSKISHGKLFLSMILNGLGFVSRTLHMYPEYFADKPVSLLLGEGVEAKHINDDVMGRFLDALYKEGVSDLYQDMAALVVNYLQLPCKSLNLDTTSFHLDGEYAADMDSQAIKITRGYSRDHRPDLNQVVLNLITENQAGLPLYMQACSGNAQDMETFKKTVKAHVKSLKAAYKNTYFIADAALYVEETLKALQEAEQLFITRVPQKLKEAKEILGQLKNIHWTELREGYAGAWHDSCYGGVPQRWLLIKSTHAKNREKHILNACVSKKTEASLKSFKKLCRKTFACETDARVAFEQWFEEQEFIGVHNVNIVPQIKHSKRGRPGKQEDYKTTFHITGHLSSSLSLKEAAEETTGFFILATNDLSDDLSMQFILDEYKSQQAVERGFRFLKSPDFLTSSLFLKKPERIEALLMVMTSCLMVYAGIEHLIRKNLSQKQLYFPDMKNKPSQRPTARWVFFCFQGICSLLIDKKIQITTNMIDRHKVILDALGKAYWNFYS